MNPQCICKQMMSVCPLTSNINFDHLVRVVFARYIQCQICNFSICNQNRKIIASFLILCPLIGRHSWFLFLGVFSLGFLLKQVLVQDLPNDEFSIFIFYFQQFKFCQEISICILYSNIMLIMGSCVFMLFYRLDCITIIYFITQTPVFAHADPFTLTLVTF